MNEWIELPSGLFVPAPPPPAIPPPVPAPEPYAGNRCYECDAPVDNIGVFGSACYHNWTCRHPITYTCRPCRSDPDRTRHLECPVCGNDGEYT